MLNSNNKAVNTYKATWAMQCRLRMKSEIKVISINANRKKVYDKIKFSDGVALRHDAFHAFYLSDVKLR